LSHIFTTGSFASYSAAATCLALEAFDLVIVSQGTSNFEGRQVVARAIEQDRPYAGSRADTLHWHALLPGGNAIRCPRLRREAFVPFRNRELSGKVRADPPNVFRLTFGVLKRWYGTEQVAPGAASPAVSLRNLTSRSSTRAMFGRGTPESLRTVHAASRGYQPSRPLPELAGSKK